MQKLLLIAQGPRKTVMAEQDDVEEEVIAEADPRLLAEVSPDNFVMIYKKWLKT